MTQAPIEAQIACVKREIRMRERVYPRFVASGKMSQQECDKELRAMRAVLETLREVAAGGGLFGAGGAA